MRRKTAEELAIEMGATIKHGINWTWADGFKSIKDGEEFIDFLEENDYDHRGIYTNNENSENETFSIRFRL